MLEDVIAIGNDLIEAKAITGHGKFRTWLEVEFRWSKNTGQNFMNVAEAAGKSTNFVHLNVPMSASYLLAAPKTPPEAFKAVGERSARGERLSLNDVKGEIAGAFSRRGPITAEERLERRDVITAQERAQRGDVDNVDDRARRCARNLVRALERFAGCSVDDAYLKSHLSSEMRSNIFGDEEAVRRVLNIVVGARSQAEDEAEIERRVHQRWQRDRDNRDARDVATIAQANYLITHYQGRGRNHPLFTPAEYGVLLRALHEDTSTAKLREKALKLVDIKKLLLQQDEGQIELRGQPPLFQT